MSKSRQIRVVLTEYQLRMLDEARRGTGRSRSEMLHHVLLDEAAASRVPEMLSDHAG